MAEAETRGANAPEITVSELAGALKRAIEDRFGYVRVRGEISGFRGPPFVGPRLFQPEGHGRPARRGHLALDARAHARQARGGARSRRHRPVDHLPRQVGLSDRDRIARARRRRRADGAARGAAQEARRGGAVRRRAQAQDAVPAAGHRRGHLAERRGHPRHSSSPRRPLSGAGGGVAGAGAGRDLRGRGRSGDRRLQRASPGRADAAPGRHDRRARRRLARRPHELQRRGRGARGGAQRDPAHRRGRPRDRLDADRSRSRQARADPDRGGRIRGPRPRRASRRDRGTRRAPEGRDPALLPIACAPSCARFSARCLRARRSSPRPASASTARAIRSAPACAGRSASGR